MKTINIKEVIKSMKATLNNLGINDYSSIPWIITKVVRITMSQYHLIDFLSKEELERCLEATRRVGKGESVSDIFGELEFYGNFFKVQKDVFYPRLSTHALIDIIKEVDIDEDSSILDLCTGTGCISITLSNILNCNVLGVDISINAINLAKENKKILNAKKANFKIMDIMEDWNIYLDSKFDVIVSNPPYWSKEEITNRQEIVRGNPAIAFDGGIEGLEFHKKIIENAPHFLKKGGQLFLEMCPSQEEKLKQLLKENFKNIKIRKDHNNINRVIGATLI